MQPSNEMLAKLRELAAIADRHPTYVSAVKSCQPTLAEQVTKAILAKEILEDLARSDCGFASGVQRACRHGHVAPPSCDECTEDVIYGS